MQSLESFFKQSENRNIHSLVKYIQAHIDAEWEKVFAEQQAKMIELYPQIGDSVYGIYGKCLFQSIHEQFKLVGLKATPNLPGSLTNSREWGEDDSDRQRWMWSKISWADGKALGTIATIFYHDHVQIRIPRPFKLIALEETGKVAVLEALSQLSPDFKNALDMREEIAVYMAQYGQEQS